MHVLNTQFFVRCSFNGADETVDVLARAACAKRAVRSLTPSSLLCAPQNCDAQMVNATGQVVASFGNIGRGYAPCRLQVTNAGQAIILDSQNVTWSINAAPVKPAAGSGQITVGQQLQQVNLPLHSWSASLTPPRSPSGKTVAWVTCLATPMLLQLTRQTVV